MTGRTRYSCSGLDFQKVFNFTGEHGVIFYWVIHQKTALCNWTFCLTAHVWNGWTSHFSTDHRQVLYTTLFCRKIKPIFQHIADVCRKWMEAHFIGQSDEQFENHQIDRDMMSLKIPSLVSCWTVENHQYGEQFENHQSALNFLSTLIFMNILRISSLRNIWESSG